jgi:hypothetical protein
MKITEIDDCASQLSSRCIRAFRLDPCYAMFLAEIIRSKGRYELSVGNK